MNYSQRKHCIVTQDQRRDQRSKLDISGDTHHCHQGSACEVQQIDGLDINDLGAGDAYACEKRGHI